MSKTIYEKYYDSLQAVIDEDTLKTLTDTFTEEYTATYLKDSSYFLYEFEDVVVTFSENRYTKNISPLFSETVINSEANQNFLDVIFEEVPYYYRETTLPRTEKDTIISITRDPGVNNVPSPMQTDFWSTWFRDSWGSLQNDLLLDIFNKLRFPYMGENQFLNANLLVELAEKAFFSSGDDAEDDITDSSLISFKNETAEDVEYLNSIIENKLSSMYQMLDYKPDLTELLSSWLESLYSSGRLDESEIKDEEILYKLQDLKYELLRRKFAGSSTLYRLALSSIDRQGSFVGKIEVGKLTSSMASGGIFRDPRFVRTLNVPGILSQFADFSDIDPISAYYKKPLAENRNYIGLASLTPLFYTSAGAIDEGRGAMIADPEVFYRGDDDSLYYSSTSEEIDNRIEDIRRLQSQFLRDNSRYVNWDAPSSIISSRSINTYFPKLDDMVYSEESAAGPDNPSGMIYRSLDSKYELVDSVTLMTKTVNYALDLEIPYVSTALISGNVLDMNVNHILYHKNSLQKVADTDYPYVTYRIANGNSLSLSDSVWIDYLKSSTERKSRVADDVRFGVQVSSYKKHGTTQLVDYFYFGISYSENIEEDVDDSFEIWQTDWRTLPSQKLNLGSSNPENNTVTNIWFIRLSYTKYDFKVQTIRGHLMTRIVHRITEDNDPLYIVHEEKFGNSDLWKSLTTYSLGLLPFTYQNISEKALKLGLYQDSFIDDISDRDMAKAIFVFSSNDLLGAIPVQIVNPRGEYTTDPVEIINSSSFKSCLSWTPDSNTKGFFYIVQRENSENPFTWSEFVRTFPISEDIIKDSVVDIETIKNTENLETLIERDGTDLDSRYKREFYPDWYDLGFYINPYLNFTENSASPLRKDLRYLKKGYLQVYAAGTKGLSTDYQRFSSVIPAYNPTTSRLYSLSELGGLGEKVALSNLAILHGNFNEVGPRSRYYYRKQDRNTTFYATDDNTSLIIDGYICEKPSNLTLYEARTTFIKVETRSEANSYFNAEPTEISDLSLGDSVEGYFVKIGDDYKLTKDVNYQQDTKYYFISYTLVKPSSSIAKKYWYKHSSSEEVIDMYLCSEGVYYTDANCTQKYVPEPIFFNATDPYLDHVQIENTEEINTTLYRPKACILGDTRKNSYQNFYREDYNKIYYDNLIPSISSIYSSDDKEALYPDYLQIRKYSSVTTESWYFDNAYDFTICLNVSFNRIPEADECILSSKNGELLLYYNFNEKAFSLVYDPDSEGSSDPITLSIPQEITTYNSYSAKTLEDGSFYSEYVYSQNYRITISAYNGKMYFLVNDKEPIDSSYPVALPLSDSSIELPSSITLFTQVSNTGNQLYPFYGSLYDLRIYKKGFSRNLLKHLNAGTINELYSYSPASYKLGNSIYEDLAIFKNTYFAQGYNRNLNSIPEITTIRAFSRDVWDSIIVDMYAATEQETISSSKIYNIDYTNPSLDISIFTQDVEYIETAGSSEESRIIQNIEYDLKCLEQKLSYPIEISNGRSPITDCKIIYNSREISIAQNDKVTLVMTSLYPVYYENQLFRSGAVFISEGSRIRTKINISLPVSPIEDTITYSADAYLKFKVPVAADLAVFWLKGENISLIYNNKLQRPTVEIKTPGASAFRKNFIVAPLLIPDSDETGKQIKGSFTNPQYLDRFYFKNLQITSALNVFLNATSYYTELRIPIATTRNTANGQENVYVSKWDAIRTLKEGTYYFTCKYPFQIQPFDDSKYASQTDMGYATLYASMLFKIEVKGTPVSYDLETYNLNNSKETLSQYTINNIFGTLKNENSLYSPEDNRTFPHRRVDINLYVLDSTDCVGLMIGDQEAYSFKWKLIGSNSSDLADDVSVILLNKERISSDIVLGSNISIPAFFSKSFNTPFFISKMKKKEVDETTRDRQISFDYIEGSADDDTIEPIRLYSDPSFEQLTVNADSYSDRDLDSLILTLGRTYKLIFEYRGLINNISYTDKVFNLNNISSDYTLSDTSEEKINFSRLSIISTESNGKEALVSEYIYRGLNSTWSTKKLDWYLNTGGFKSADGGWEGFTRNEEGSVIPNFRVTDPAIYYTQEEADAYNAEYELTPEDLDYKTTESIRIPAVAYPEYYYGNPYSKSSTQNLVLSDNTKDRRNICELSYFPYIIEPGYNDLTENTWSCSYMSVKISAFSTAGRPGVTLFNEISLLNTHRENIFNRVCAGISGLLQKAYGVFSQLSIIEPRLIGSSSNITYWRINPVVYDLYGATAMTRNVMAAGNFVIERKGNFSNNLILNQYFDDTTNWMLRDPNDPSVDLNRSQSSYIPDDTWDEGKDMYTITLPSTGSKKRLLGYKTGTTSYTARFESAINVKVCDSTGAPLTMDLSDPTVRDSIIKANIEFTKGSTTTKLDIVNWTSLTSTDGTEKIGWYNISIENENVISCTSISFVFENMGDSPLRLSFTKAVIRKSETFKHTTGFSDVVFKSVIDQDSTKAILDRHSLVYFQDSEEQRTIALVFKNRQIERNVAPVSLETVVSSISGQANAAAFIKTWAYDKNVSSLKKNKLLQPWVRRIFWYQINPDLSLLNRVDLGSAGLKKSKAVTYKYSFKTNNVTGVRKKELEKEENTSIFKDLIMDYDSTTSSLSFSADISNVDVEGLNIELDLGSTSTSTGTLEDFSTLYLDDERFSGLTNCFYPARYLKNLDTSVAVTNIQLLNDTNDERTVVYELEYLPIIYNEKDQHISFNIMIHTTSLGDRLEP